MPGGPVFPGSPDMIHARYDACNSASRAGSIPFSVQGGLPGFQKGGAYTTLLPSDNSLAGFPVIQKVPCTANYMNPLNQRGGGNLASSAAPILEENNAAYGQNPGNFFNGSTNTPFMINQPLSTVFNSKACGQTGGKRSSRGKRKNGKNGKNGKKRKSRK